MTDDRDSWVSTVVVQVWALRDSPGAGRRVRVVEQRGFGHF
ncbi:hypothetical protein ACKI16_30520 [Streptomyces scabiei]